MAVPVQSGAISGTFLCGEKLAGQADWTVPHAKPQLLLGGGVFVYFTDPPVVVTIGKPRLELVARSVALKSEPQALQFSRPVLLLVPGSVVGGTFSYVMPEKPLLLLQARSFLNTISGGVEFGSPVLELVARAARARIPGLIPSEGFDLILIPAVEEDLLLIPAVEEDLLLVPTTEAVG